MKLTKKEMIFALVLCVSCIASIYAMFHNYALYKDPIAKVVSTKVIDTEKITDQYDNNDVLTREKLTLQLQNGAHKGQFVTTMNEYSTSQATDFHFKKGADVFVSIHDDKTVTIEGVKRDQYVVIALWMLIFLLLAVGRKQGLLSIVTLGVNVAVLSYALDLYITKQVSSLLLICSVCIVFFTVFSLLVVNGVNKKTFTAVIVTLIGTTLTLALTFIVFHLTNERGMRYEELQFLTRPYKTVFYAGLFLGSLGAIMDVAITMSSSLFSLYEEHPNITLKELRASGMEIGKDIMGTMTNILFFAYVSGSIPMLILYFKNATTFGYTLSINLSLEIVRALVGGIGIVMAIPIGLYVTLLFILKSKKVA